MSIPFCCSDNQSDALRTVQMLYPQVRTVYYCISLDGTPVQPGTIRIRSRERHSPGSGNYFCSHITKKGELVGYLRGNAFYATRINSERSSLSEDNFHYTRFTQTTVQNEWYYSYWRSGMIRSRYVLSILSRPVISGYTISWTETAWDAEVVGTRNWDSAKAAAMSSDPAVRGVVWRRYAELSASEHITGPTFEDQYVRDKIDYGTFPGLDSYLNDAYISAFESLPAIKTNNIMNLKAIWDFLNAIVSPLRGAGKLIDGVGTIGDSWLGYRYVYSTTKADILELSEYVERMRALRHSPSARSYGFKKYETNGEIYEFRCSITVQMEDYLGIYNTVERLGLALDAYNLWDMIPYSFMVDWFLHIGNLIESGRNRRYAMRLKPTAVWFSMTHTFTNQNGDNQVDYYRWRPERVVLAELPASMLSTGGAAKGTTWMKRAADAVSIFFL